MTEEFHKVVFFDKLAAILVNISPTLYNYWYDAFPLL